MIQSLRYLLHRERPNVQTTRCGTAGARVRACADVVGYSCPCGRHIATIHTVLFMDDRDAETPERTSHTVMFSISELGRKITFEEIRINLYFVLITKACCNDDRTPCLICICKI